jgi:hypothetical protein
MVVSCYEILSCCFTEKGLVRKHYEELTDISAHAGLKQILVIRVFGSVLLLEKFAEE